MSTENTNSDSDDSTSAATSTDAADSLPSPSTPASGPENAKGAGKKSLKKPVASEKPILGKLRFALPAKVDLAVRYASVMAEVNGGVTDPEAFVTEAVIRHLQTLRRKGLEFPAGLLPD